VVFSKNKALKPASFQQPQRFQSIFSIYIYAMKHLSIAVTILAVSLILVSGVGLGQSNLAQSVDGPETVHQQTGSQDFQIVFGQSELDAANLATEGRVNLTFSGIDTGTPVEITSDSHNASQLTTLINGTQTDDGVRVTVPTDRTLVFDFRPFACQHGDYTFTARNLQTNATTTDSISVATEDIFAQSFTQSNYSGALNREIPIETVTNCNGIGLRIWDADSPFNATVTVEDNSRFTAVTLTPTADNASHLFSVRGEGTITNASVTALPERLNGTYRMAVTPPPPSPLHGRFPPESGSSVDGQPQRATLTISDNVSNRRPACSGSGGPEDETPMRAYCIWQQLFLELREELATSFRETTMSVHSVTAVCSRLDKP
jgi:hypothetical protein